jgi:hypothetical protein
MLSLHQGLYPSLHEAKGYSLRCQALRLLLRNLCQQLWDLDALLHYGFILPKPIVYWRKHAGLRHLRRSDLYVESLIFPILIGVNQVVLKVQLLCLLAYLHSGPTNYN